MRRAILEALRAKYEAEIAEADAIANIYLENSVGIGEHPQHLEEVNKQIEKIANAKEKCGSMQLMPAVIYTIIPNLFIFGGLLMALMFFPGWKAPFSNTIGYVITTLMNIKTTFNNI